MPNSEDVAIGKMEVMGYEIKGKGNGMANGKQKLTFRFEIGKTDRQ